MITYIEDCLEHIVGMREPSAAFSVDKNDYTIIHSIARQVFKGTALTDRQFDLMKEKLRAYEPQFVAAGFNNFSNVIEQTRLPLREIDRSKYIKLQNNEIVIRFPFKKSDIILIQEFSGSAEGYAHKSSSHEHTFAYNEFNVVNLLDRFNAKEYTIDTELIEVYNKIKTISNTPQQYLSGIANNELINIKPALVPLIKSELGELSETTLVQFIDRKFRYGFDLFDKIDNISLVHKIASRTTPTYHSKPSLETTGSILGALWELNRFPLLVVLDKANAEHQLYEFINYYRDILPAEEQSVLFRLEESDSSFNQLVKDRKLNNWVDKNTKIVYISKDKLPKIIINNDWKPSVAFTYDSHIDKFVDGYVSFNCDLIVYREEDTSPFRKHSRIYG
jgi:hypothetical protein